MDTPRRTYTFGPITVTIRRGGDESGVRRVGAPASALVHILVIALVVILSTEQEKRAAEAAQQKKPPVEITFYDPLPPPPTPKAVAPKPAKPKPPEPAEPRFRREDIPPPPTDKPLRMKPTPDDLAKLKTAPPDSRKGSVGRNDTRPAGGLAGGPLPQRAAGVPESGSIGREVDAPPGTERPDEPKDLEGRLRDFRRALEAPRPPTNGPKGGGQGSGGVEMPAFPETGFGFRNLQFEGNDYDWGDYSRQIYGIIWRAWHRRLLADSPIFERWASENHRWMLDDMARVRFTVARSGQVIDVAVEGPSACYPLDDSAREALQEVVLPPLPDDFQRDSETIHATFSAQGEIRTMHSYLQYLHEVLHVF